MWATISTEQAQALFESSADFQYRVRAFGDGLSYDEWDDYFHSGKCVGGYTSPEMLAVLYPLVEFRVQTE